MHSQIVADAYKLYLSFGGLHHREIEASMRANGYPTFSRRVFYDRKERGKIYPGWIRKFRWNERSSSFTATSQDNHPADEASPPLLCKEGSFKDKLSPR